MSMEKRMTIIKEEPSLPKSKQCDFLGVPKSSFYFKSKKDVSYDTWLMNEIHELWMKRPFYGYRRITAVLNREGYEINHKRVQRLMKLMNLSAIHPKQTTVCDPRREKHPYLLSGLSILHPNHVWCSDITYIKMRTGFVYLTGLIDLFSRYILSWEVSISMETSFCLSVLERALLQNKPRIVNTDQGSQFTSNEWSSALKEKNVAISMDAAGCWVDNVYIERFWRSAKQEEVYLKPYDSVDEAKSELGKYVEFYNHERPHQSLRYKTPAEVYYAKEVDSRLIFKNKKVVDMG